MINYGQHLCLTVWRKKSTLLIVAALLILLIFGLHYTKNDEKSYNGTDREEKALGDALIRSINVKFFQSISKTDKTTQSLSPSTTLNEEVLRKLDQPVRDEIVRRQKQSIELQEMEQQLGIPFVGLDLKNPYIPKERIVHFDLKGAPPKVAFIKKMFNLIKSMGATGILLEYEDMFPYTGILKNLSTKNAYTLDQIKEIIKLAEESKLHVIPLIQTFGHMEFALKHREWSHLREVPGSPQALCPSRNNSLDLVREVVNQVMSVHPDAKYLHIGCDEVFQIGECDICRLELHENLFLKHIKNVVNVIREKHPKLRLIIWDDMLRHLSQQTMLDINLGSLVEPMIWVYAEDVYRFVQPQVWSKYAAVFKTAWTASAFKGAFGETLYVPNSKRHLENNLRWLDVMSQQDSAFKHGLAGLVITGWQRYDHFAVLCELLPAALPSLALSLTAISHGYFNSSLKDKFLSALSCPQQNSVSNAPFVSLDTDPYLWDKLGRCMFPGSAFFRLTYRLHSNELEAKEYLDVTKNQKGWMTDYNVRRNYSLPLRVDELTLDLPRIYHGMLGLARSAVDAMADIFDNYTIAEWIEQRIYPYIIELEKIQNQSIALKSVNQWAARPLPPLKDLQRLGVPIPVN